MGGRPTGELVCRGLHIPREYSQLLPNKPLNFHVNPPNQVDIGGGPPLFAVTDVASMVVE